MVQISFSMWRCRICGEIYFGINEPSHCPYCGSHRQTAYKDGMFKVDHPMPLLDMKATDLDHKDRRRVQKTLIGELYDKTVYNALSVSIKDLESVFTKLASIEEEHSELITKTTMLKLSDDPKYAKVLHPTIKRVTHINETLDAAFLREKTTAMNYRKYAQKTHSARMKEVWLALAEVEDDHATLIQTMLSKT